MKFLMTKLVAATVVCVVMAGLLNSARAQINDPRVKWRSLRTPLVEVNYPESQAETARHVLAILEGARSEIVEYVGDASHQRIQVRITDDTDSSNGSASSYPYNFIRLFTVAPDDLSVLQDYDEWMSVLAIHEYVHVLHLDTYSGLPGVVNKVLGKSWVPNALSPRWFTEGIAVHLETKLTSGGRLRSTMFDMYMRSAMLDSRPLRIDQLSNAVDQWPRGTTWYLYGGFFIRWVTERYGDDALKEIIRRYGKAPVPYLLNRTAKRVLGKTFTALYKEFLVDMRAHYEAQRKVVVQAGLIEGQRLTCHGEYTAAPRFITETTGVYYANDGRSDAALRMFDTTKLPPNEPLCTACPQGRVAREVVTHVRKPHHDNIVRIAGAAYASVAPDGTFVFESLDNYRNIYRFYDLFRFDPTTGERTRLTHGLRARYPDVAPDGKRVVFVVQADGTGRLMIANLDDIEGTMRPLLPAERGRQYFTPRFSPDGTSVAFGAWRSGGRRDIGIVDVPDELEAQPRNQNPRNVVHEPAPSAPQRDVRWLTDDRAIEAAPTWSSDQQHLFFSSDRTGISNIYAYDLNANTLSQVTNVVNGAYHPAVSPSGTSLVYLGYTQRGFDLFYLELDPARWRPALESTRENRSRDARHTTIANVVSKRYQPGRSMYPRAVRFDLANTSIGYQLGVGVSGSDSVGFHSWSSRVGFNLEFGSVDFESVHTIRRLPTPITFQVFRSTQRRGGLVVGDRRSNYIEDTAGGSVSISYSFIRSFHVNSISGTYGLTRRTARKPLPGELLPEDPLPQLPLIGTTGDASLRWRYSDARSHTYDISRSAGRTYLINFDTSHPIHSQNPRVVLRALWSAQRYFEIPWLEHHVVALRYTGGASWDKLGQSAQFGLGGFPDVSLLDQALEFSELGSITLRGYAPVSRFGDRMQLAQMEYRFPIARIQSGPAILPLFFQRVYANLFVDAGDAYFGSIRNARPRIGYGAELLFDVLIGYALNYSLRLGIAHGPMESGEFQLYANFGRPF